MVGKIIAVFLVFVFFDILVQIYKRKGLLKNKKQETEDYLLYKYGDAFKFISQQKREAMYCTKDGYFFKVFCGDEIYDNKIISIIGKKIGDYCTSNLVFSQKAFVNCRIGIVNESVLNENWTIDEIIDNSDLFISNILVGVSITENENLNIDDFIQEISKKIKTLPFKKISFKIIFFNASNIKMFENYISEYNLYDGDLYELESYILREHSQDF